MLSALLTGCVTSTGTANGIVYEATLTNQPSNAVRDLIQTYIFDTLGPDYIVNVEELTRTDTLTDRGRGQTIGRPIPVPNVRFHLELTEISQGPICRLVPELDLEDVPVLLLPPQTRCRLLPSEI